MVNDSIILVHKNLNLDKRKHLPDKSLKLVVSLYAFLISSPNNSLLNYSQFESGLLFAIWYIQLCGSNFFFLITWEGKRGGRFHTHTSLSRSEQPEASRHAGVLEAAWEVRPLCGRKSSGLLHENPLEFPGKKCSRILRRAGGSVPYLLKTLFFINSLGEVFYQFFFSFSFFFFFFFFFFFRAIPAAYGGSQARSWIRDAAAGLHHSHSNTGSKLHLWPTP